MLATSTLHHFIPLRAMLVPSETYAKRDGYGPGQYFTSKHFEAHSGALTHSMPFLIWLGHSLSPNSVPRDLVNHLSCVKTQEHVGPISSLRIYALLL